MASSRLRPAPPRPRDPLPADLDLLRVLSALWKARSVTGAGRLVGLSQPATSAALARLRDYFDDRLFDRRGHALVPSELCARVAPRVDDAMEALRAAVLASPTANPSEAREWTVGCVDAVIAVLVPALVRELVGHAPHARLRVIPVAPDDGARLLDEARVDALVAPLTTGVRGRRVTELFAVDFVVAMSAKHPLTARRRVGLAQLVAYPHAVVSFEGRTKFPVDASLARLGLERRITVTAPSFLALVPVLEGTELLAFLPKPLVESTNGARLASVPIPKELPTPRLTMALHQRGHGENIEDVWLRARVVAAAESLSIER